MLSDLRQNLVAHSSFLSYSLALSWNERSHFRNEIHDKKARKLIELVFSFTQSFVLREMFLTINSLGFVNSPECRIKKEIQKQKDFHPRWWNYRVGWKYFVFLGIILQPINVGVLFKAVMTKTFVHGKLYRFHLPDCPWSLLVKIQLNFREFFPYFFKFSFEKKRVFFPWSIYFNRYRVQNII